MIVKFGLFRSSGGGGVIVISNVGNLSHLPLHCAADVYDLDCADLEGVKGVQTPCKNSNFL